MRRVAVVAGAAVVLLGPAVGVASAAIAATGTRLAVSHVESVAAWGKAKEVPGTATLNTGGNAGVNSVSCAAAGNCSAGGSYTTKSGHQQAFVVNETHGTWGKAEEVPGTGTLNTGGDADLSSVSCAAAGDCSAVGFYLGSSHSSEPFVVNETNGTWGKAKEVPGIASLATGSAQVHSVSCAAAGNCSAVGYYADRSGHSQALLVSETHGTWGKAEEVPGIAHLNTGGDAAAISVSCARGGGCGAGGFYVDSSSRAQAFVVTEARGIWGKAEEVPGTASLNTGNAELNSVSCALGGACSAGGYYLASSGHRQAFVVSEAKGTWGKAKGVPGTTTLNTVSCAAAGDCSAGGYYANGPGRFQAFVVDEASGTWGKAEEVPGTATLNIGGIAGLDSVSCATADNCSAGGYYKDRSGHFQAFVVSRT